MQPGAARVVTEQRAKCMQNGCTLLIWCHDLYREDDHGSISFDQRLQSTKVLWHLYREKRTNSRR
jgi:hypothetical protein